MLDMYAGFDINEMGDIWVSHTARCFAAELTPQAVGCILHFLSVGVHPFEDGAKLAILNGRLNMKKDSPHAIFHDLIRILASSLLGCY